MGRYGTLEYGDIECIALCCFPCEFPYLFASPPTPRSRSRNRNRNQAGESSNSQFLHPSIPPPLLHSLPKVVGIEKPRELGVNIDDMNIPLLNIPDDGFCIVTRIIGFDIDAQRTINLQSQSVASHISHLLTRHTPPTEDRNTDMVSSSNSLRSRIPSSPSTPCASSSCNRPLNPSNSCSNLSASISSSEAAFAIRNFCVSSSTIRDA